MVLPLALAWIAETDFRLGDWARTQAEAAESIALGDELGRPFESLNGLITLAALRGAQERTDEALGLLDRADLIINASGFMALSRTPTAPGDSCISRSVASRKRPTHWQQPVRPCARQESASRTSCLGRATWPRRSYDRGAARKPRPHWPCSRLRRL